MLSIFTFGRNGETMAGFVHHTLIFTVQDQQVSNMLKQECIAVTKKRMQVNNPESLFTNTIESLINNFHTFSFCPDGSKEGYDTSVEGDVCRDEMIKLVQSFQSRFSDLKIYFAEVAIADNEIDGLEKAKIVSHS